MTRQLLSGATGKLLLQAEQHTILNPPSYYNANMKMCAILQPQRNNWLQNLAGHFLRLG